MFWGWFTLLHISKTVDCIILKLDNSRPLNLMMKPCEYCEILFNGLDTIVQFILGDAVTQEVDEQIIPKIHQNIQMSWNFLKLTTRPRRNFHTLQPMVYFEVRHSKFFKVCSYSTKINIFKNIASISTKRERGCSLRFSGNLCNREFKYLERLLRNYCFQRM